MNKDKGTRLVAMIEERGDTYEVINFLPDIKLKHKEGEIFEVIENKDYIKIPYAEGINDLTVIVGENGVGKTRLVRDILKPIFSEERKIYLIFKDNKEDKWLHFRAVPEKYVKDKISKKGYEFFIFYNSQGEEIEDSSNYGNKNVDNIDTVLVSHSLELNAENGSIPDRKFGQDKSTTKYLYELSGDYRSLIQQDATNQILFLIGRDQSNESFKNRLSSIIDFTGKRLKFGIDSGGVKRDREHRESIVRNLDHTFKYQYGYNVLESADEFIDEKINESLLQILGLDDSTIENIKEKFCQFPKIDIEGIEGFIGSDVSEFLTDENNTFSYLDLVQYKDDIGDLQDTIKNAYRRCFISILAYSSQKAKIEESNNISVDKLCTILDSNLDIPYSIQKIIKLITEEKLRGEDYEDILKRFYYYVFKNNQELFKELMKVFEENNLEKWLKIFDEAFNFSGTKKNAVFTLKSNEFRYFITNLIDSEKLKELQNWKELLENFVSFLNEPSPNDNSIYHLRLLEQLKLYWSITWEGLSSGEYAFLNQFGRLKSVLRNETRENMVLLFDEVDLALHPEWQRKWISSALPIIGEMFKDKNVQIIMTTHSPIMLSDIYPENVIFLKKDSDGNRLVIDNTNQEGKAIKTFGQNIHDLYRDSFFLDSTRGQYASEIINLTIKTLYNVLNNPSNKEKLIEEFFSKFELDKPKNEKLFEDFTKQIINSIGENLISKKLLSLHKEIFEEDIDIQIKKLEDKLEKLRLQKVGNGDK